MVQNGNVEEAIKAYESQNYVEKFKQEAFDKVEIIEARKKLEIVENQKFESMQNLLAAIERQAELKKKQEEERRKAEEARRKAEEEAKKQAEEEARRQAEEETYDC